MTARYHDRSYCTVVRRDGRDCDRFVEVDAPLSLCAEHIDDAYRHRADQIRAQLAAISEIVGQPRVPAPPPPEFVYYVRFRDGIKIGTSASLLGRLSNLPHDEVLAIEPGGHQLEQLRHQQFAAARDHGEWFSATDELLSHCAMLRSHYPAEQTPRGPAQLAIADPR